MLKRRIKKEDGRYLIYYSFPDGPPGKRPSSAIDEQEQRSSDDKCEAKQEEDRDV